MRRVVRTDNQHSDVLLWFMNEERDERQIRAAFDNDCVGGSSIITVFQYYRNK